MAKYEELTGKRVIVTGGASGIGRATVKRFVDEGARVVAFDIKDTSTREGDWTLERLKKEIPGIAGTVQADVSSEESVTAAFAKADEILGGLDVLISNAGISVRNKFIETDFKQWRRTMGINLDGMFLCCKEASKRMLEQKSGVILCTASTNGMQGHPYYTDYNASKAGVILLVKSIAKELAPYIRVNAVCPGYVWTPMQEAEYTPEMLAEVNEGIWLKRHVDPSEIAAAYAFLASDDARYITGVNYPVDAAETA